MHDFTSNPNAHKAAQLQAASPQNATPMRAMTANSTSALATVIGSSFDFSNSKTLEYYELELKTNLVSMACHDMLSPMTCIRHCLEVLAAGDASSHKQANALSMAFRSVNKIESVARLWLDYDSALHGVHNSSPIRVCVQAAIDEAISTVRILADDRNIAFKVQVENSVKKAVINSVHLDQILSNLLSNAVQYADRNSRVTIKATTNGSSVIISVANKGELISDVQKKLLFKKFSRIGTHPNRSRGSLGLFLCHWLLSLDGGSIECSNTSQGDGTVFTCIIPLGLSQREAPKTGRNQ
jgi:signal transduction histidine kinase